MLVGSSSLVRVSWPPLARDWLCSGWYWWTSFLFYVYRSTVISSVAIWYFSLGGPVTLDEANASAFLALSRMLSKNLGSMALGALINPFVLVFNFFVRKGIEAQHSKRTWVRYMFGWLVICGCFCRDTVRRLTKFDMVFVGSYRFTSGLAPHCRPQPCTVIPIGQEQEQASSSFQRTKPQSFSRTAWLISCFYAGSSSGPAALSSSLVRWPPSPPSLTPISMDSREHRVRVQQLDYRLRGGDCLLRVPLYRVSDGCVSGHHIHLLPRRHATHQHTPLTHSQNSSKTSAQRERHPPASHLTSTRGFRP